MASPVILDSRSRFKVWDRPATYPLVDLIDGTAEGPLFDLGIELEARDGAAYVKVIHIEEMARVLGWKSPEEVAEILEENENLKNRVDNLPQEVERLKDGIDRVVSDFYDRLDSRPSFPVDASKESDEDSRQSAGNSDAILEELGEGFGTPSK